MCKWMGSWLLALAAIASAPAGSAADMNKALRVGFLDAKRGGRATPAARPCVFHRDNLPAAASFAKIPSSSTPFGPPHVSHSTASFSMTPHPVSRRRESAVGRIAVVLSGVDVPSLT